MKVSNYSPSGMGLQVKNKVKISLPWESKTSIPLLSELRKQALLYKKIKSKSTFIITLQVASSGFPGWPYQLLEAAGCWGDCSLLPFPPAEAHSVLKRWLRRHIKVRTTGNLLGSFPGLYSHSVSCNYDSMPCLLFSCDINISLCLHNYV